jgi:hypothetical protein
LACNQNIEQKQSKDWLKSLAHRLQPSFQRPSDPKTDGGAGEKSNGATQMNGLIKLGDVDFVASLSIAICSLSAALYVFASGLGGGA